MRQVHSEADAHRIQIRGQLPRGCVAQPLAQLHLHVLLPTFRSAATLLVMWQPAPKEGGRARAATSDHEIQETALNYERRRQPKSAEEST